MIGFSSNFHLSFLEFKFLFLNQHVPNQLSLPADDWRQQEDSLDEETMTLLDDTMRPANDSQEMSPHLMTTKQL